MLVQKSQYHQFNKRKFLFVLNIILSVVCICLAAYFKYLLKDENSPFQRQHCLSVQSNQELTIQQIEKIQRIEGVNYSYMYLDEYKFLGLGFKEERYQDKDVLLVSEEILKMDKKRMVVGKMPKQDHEIILSLPLAKKLAGEDFEEILGKMMIGWYKTKLEVIRLKYHVVGIFDTTDAVESFYQPIGATYSLLSQFFSHDVKCSVSLVYIDRTYSLKKIKAAILNLNHDYQIKEVGLMFYKEIKNVKYFSLKLFLYGVLHTLILKNMNNIEITKDFQKK